MDELTPNELEALRQRIGDELADLDDLSKTSAGDRAPVELDQQSFGRVSRADAMRAQAMAVASDTRRAARVTALRAAQERIDLGDYGYCEDCDEPIAAARLRADPATRLCVSCAQAREK